MTVEEMRTEKEKRHLSNEDISRASGIPFATVQKIFSGITETPRKSTRDALEQVFRPESGQSFSYTDGASPAASLIREPAPAYQYRAEDILHSKKQGEFTIEDYLKLPDDQRYELIDGVLYVMSSPLSVHQLIAGFIYAQMLDFATAHNGSCIPMISPMDVMPDPKDRKTILEPDVMVICDRKKIRRARVYGAPDMVIEVLSRSTRTKDMIIKLAKYKNTGVREYWMIDPDKKNVIKYLFDSDNVDVSFHSFEEKVPVHIFKDECVIDFKKISDSIAFVYENEKQPNPFQ